MEDSECLYNHWYEIGSNSNSFFCCNCVQCSFDWTFCSYTVPKKEVSEFTRDSLDKVESTSLADAIQRALKFLDNRELPAHWERGTLFHSTSLESESDDNFSDVSTNSLLKCFSIVTLNFFKKKLQPFTFILNHNILHYVLKIMSAEHLPRLCLVWQILESQFSITLLHKWYALIVSCFLAREILI